MSLLKIIQYGHPLLREKSLDVKAVGEREKALIAAMAATMYAARGVGLAAPQVGVLQRIFVLDVDQHREDEEAKDEVAARRLQVFINPEIIEESEEDDSFTEGCLSIPGMESEIFRPVRVKVAARDENFEPFEMDAEDFFARVIQHETDHLNGVLYIDHLPLIKRSLLAGSLHKIKKASLEELSGLSKEYPIRLEG